MSTYETYWRIAQHIGAGGRIYLGRIYTMESDVVNVDHAVKVAKWIRGPAFADVRYGAGNYPIPMTERQSNRVGRAAWCLSKIRTGSGNFWYFGLYGYDGFAE